MIGKIKGIIEYIAADHVLLETSGGIGYTVYCTSRLLRSLECPGIFLTVYTQLIVREDSWQLFGFQTLLEREWHTCLMRVQGVGAKAALSIVENLQPEQIEQAVLMDSADIFRATPGIGPKIAKRIVTELNGRVPSIAEFLCADQNDSGLYGASGEPIEKPRNTAQNEAISKTTRAVADTLTENRAKHAMTRDALSALLALGYNRQESVDALQKISSPTEDASSLATAALRILGSTAEGN
jgi:Holliday junction DNA helicase RuvA